tara:strand:- start:6752 stop:7441 length:690 start_codon:yes stop_codon:yes gene_type:complete
MENPAEKKIESFDFLEIEKVEQNFAAVNINLLKGRHIQQDEYKLFDLLDDYEDEFKFYYDRLYQLELKRKISSEVHYFYLDFPEENKGRLAAQELHHFLTEQQTIVTLLLLNMYYSEYFSFEKEFTWEDIKKEILNGENSEYYKRYFFKKIKSGGYSDTQWRDAKKAVDSTIKGIEKLGWCERKKGIERGEIQFTVRESIERFVEMYEDELSNFDAFAEKISKKRIDEN